MESSPDDRIGRLDDTDRGVCSLAGVVVWCLGDAIRYGEMRGDWGEMYAQALEATPYTYGTLRQAVFVAGKYPDLLNRFNKLPWAFHQVAAARKDMDTEERQDELLAAQWVSNRYELDIRIASSRKGKRGCTRRR